MERNELEEIRQELEDLIWFREAVDDWMVLASRYHWLVLRESELLARAS